jgi:hypothetical protein
MSTNAALVVSTFRQHGNTWQVRRAANGRLNFPVLYLGALDTSYFDYESKNLDYDFIPIIEKLVVYHTIFLVSPVSWHRVSAQITTFSPHFS